MCFDLTHAPVATAARAAATGLVSMSTRPDPEGSGTVEIATWRRPRFRVVWDLRELTTFSTQTVLLVEAHCFAVSVDEQKKGYEC